MSEHICTKEDPYNREKHYLAEHPDAEFLQTESYSNGDEFDWYKCPHCGETLREEVRP